MPPHDGSPVSFWLQSRVGSCRLWMADHIVESILKGTLTLQDSHRIFSSVSLARIISSFSSPKFFFEPPEHSPACVDLRGGAVFSLSAGLLSFITDRNSDSGLEKITEGLRAFSPRRIPPFYRNKILLPTSPHLLFRRVAIVGHVVPCPGSLAGSPYCPRRTFVVAQPPPLFFGSFPLSPFPRVGPPNTPHSFSPCTGTPPATERVAFSGSFFISPGRSCLFFRLASIALVFPRLASCRNPPSS